MARLQSTENLPKNVTTPSYTPNKHHVGMVHMGVGAFHRVHQAVYTDEVLGRKGGNWRICGVSLKNPNAAQALNPQNGLYTVLVRHETGMDARVIGSLSHVIPASGNLNGVLEALTHPATRIVSLTVTEKAYGIHREEGIVDQDHPAIKSDLATPHEPLGCIGLLVEALRLRRNNQTKPFTVLCCDNLPQNGVLLRAGVLHFATLIEPALSDWIAQHVTFPSTMVDRITPKPTKTTLLEAEQQLGFQDLAAVETEPFKQWVIEDNFCNGRPDWNIGGAIFTDNVTPYEKMKLRMLNGTHSLIAYAGLLANCPYVRNVMNHAMLRSLIGGYLKAASQTLQPIHGINFEDYANELIQRFTNPAIAHQTSQIATDGTQKIPQRILEPALHALENGQRLDPFAFAIACWMAFVLGCNEQGTSIELNDPRVAELSSALASVGLSARMVSSALHDLPNLFPEALKENLVWRTQVETALQNILQRGVLGAIEKENWEHWMG